MIKTKTKIMDEINNAPQLLSLFNSWDEDQRESFLDICTGNKGVKMLYDSYFKEILNPEYTPDRLSYLLSVLLKRKATVKQVLSNDSTRLGDELSLVITDIVVELEDKSIANIEVQRVGFAFTGERSSCYSADLLLRQYKRLRDKYKKKFTYKDVCPVYTIVFFEKSTYAFKEFDDIYIHNFTTVSDTGLKLNMLQNFIFIPVDIFLKHLHNDGIKGELEAWLTFLGCDETEYIVKLIRQYPYFKQLYQDLYEMCSNIERMMNMFSKELQILDRNTIKYMIDELQEQLDAANDAISDKDKTIEDKDKTIKDKDKTIEDKDKTIKDKDKTIADLKAEIDKLKNNK